MDNRIVAFIDNDVSKQGSLLYGKNIISINDELIQSDSLILIAASPKSAAAIYMQLMGMYVLPKENVLYPRAGHIRAYSGWQYFDVFSPQGREFFVDAGAYNGSTSVDFAEWAGENYGGIFAFDPYGQMQKWYNRSVTEHNLHNVIFWDKGLWSHTDQFKFSKNGAGSRIDFESGVTAIETVSLDEVMKDYRPSFIKMDIEGAELSALQGARNIIEKYHPRMAISIYHKKSDILTIPDYILNFPSINFETIP